MDGYDEQEALIPGLPDDVALDCLARVPHRCQPGLRHVCRRWRDLVTAPVFTLHRVRIGVAEDLVFFVQAAPLPGDNKAAHRAPSSCSLAGLNATTGDWIRSSDAVPAFAMVAAAAGKVMVIGGWDPDTLEPLEEVRVVDPATGAWRPGRPMPAAMSFFGCAGAGDRVYVAGGHDAGKNAMRSAAAYDVGRDEWVELPAMAEERDECHVVAAGGRIWAVSGYRTEEQGRFQSDAESYDPEADRWEKIGEIWEGGGGAGDGLFEAAGGRIGCVDGRGVREYERNGWKEKGKGPEGMRSPAVAVAIGGGGGAERVLVMGMEMEGNGLAGWVLEEEKWKRVPIPVGFSGFVYSAAAVRV